MYKLEIWPPCTFKNGGHIFTAHKVIVTSSETHLENDLSEYSLVAYHLKGIDETITKIYIISILSGTQIYEIIAQKGQKGPRGPYNMVLPL